MFDQIDHIGIAVRDIDAVLDLYQNKLGMPLVHRETLPAFSVEAALFDVGDSHIELISPLSDDSGVGRFLQKTGGGLHHIAYRVSDIEQSLAELKRLGLRLIDESPRPGLRNSRVAFVHPSALNRVLTELVQPNHSIEKTHG